MAATVSSQPAVPGMDPLDCVINPSVVADLGSGVPGILSDISVARSDFVKAPGSKRMRRPSLRGALPARGIILIDSTLSPQSFFY